MRNVTSAKEDISQEVTEMLRNRSFRQRKCGRQHRCRQCNLTDWTSQMLKRIAGTVRKECNAASGWVKEKLAPQLNVMVVNANFGVKAWCFLTCLYVRTSVCMCVSEKEKWEKKCKRLLRSQNDNWKCRCDKTITKIVKKKIKVSKFFTAFSGHFGNFWFWYLRFTCNIKGWRRQRRDNFENDASLKGEDRKGVNYSSSLTRYEKDAVREAAAAGIDCIVTFICHKVCHLNYR